MQRLPDFVYAEPRSLAEACALLANEPSARVFAGGTDLLPNLRHGIGAPRVLVSLAQIEGIDGITADEEGLHLGARTTLAQLAGSRLVRERVPAVAQAAASVAAPAHRNAATLGGNLALDTRCIYYNQSEWWREANGYCLKHRGTRCHVAPQGNHCHAAYAGDVAPALLALGAEIEIANAAGARRVPLAAVYRDDGRAHLALQPADILTHVHVPTAATALRSGYVKARVRGAMDFPLAGVAAALALDGPCIARLSVALTGVASRPFVLRETEAFVGGRVVEGMLRALGKLIERQVSPMRTTTVSAHYRRKVASIHAQRLVADLARQ